MMYICDNCGMAFQIVESAGNPIDEVKDFLACPYCGIVRANKHAIKCEDWDRLCFIQDAIIKRNYHARIVEEIRTERLHRSTESHDQEANNVNA